MVRRFSEYFDGCLIIDVGNCQNTLKHLLLNSVKPEEVERLKIFLDPAVDAYILKKIMEDTSFVIESVEVPGASRDLVCYLHNAVNSSSLDPVRSTVYELLTFNLMSNWALGKSEIKGSNLFIYFDRIQNVRR